MGYKPFKYGMNLSSVYSDGVILDKSVAKITPSDLVESFKTGCTNMAALSLETGYITAPAAPHILVNAFKNLLAVACESGYKLKALEDAMNSKAAAPV
jgi:large subunit ribosomal protein LP0